MARRFSAVADEIVRYAESLGFEMVRCKKHIIMRRGNKTICFAKTPSDKRARLNIIRDIDKAVQP